MNKRTLMTGAVLLLGIGIIGIYFLPAHNESVPANTITIFTTPLKILPPHEHTISNTQVDSITAKGHEAYVTSDIVTVPEDMWVSQMRLVMKNAPMSVIHHFIIYSGDKPQLICPQNSEQVLVSGASETTKEKRFEEPYGIFLKKGTTLLLTAMLHNPLPPEGEGGTYHDVSVGVELTIEKNNPNRYKPLSFYHLAVGQAANCDYVTKETVTIFTVPPSAAHFTQQSNREPGNNATYITFQEPGVIISMGGHLHPWEGGEKVEAYLNGSLIRTFIPQRTSNLPWSWATPSSHDPIRIKKGDTITMSATYSNKTTQPIIDAMGVIGFFFSPDATPSTGSGQASTQKSQ